MRNKFAILSIIILGLLFYGLTLRGVPGNPAPNDFKHNLDQAGKPLELSPERGRFATVLALGDFHTYDLGQTLAEAVYPDAGYYGGKFYSLFAPGLAYLDLPFYQLGKTYNLSQVFSFGFISLMGIMSMLCLYQIAREILKLPPAASLFAALVFGFATTSWSYAITLYQHLVTVFFMLSAFYAVYKFGQQGRFSWLWGAWVWLAYGLAITIDYPNALLLLPVMAYFALVSFRVTRKGKTVSLALRPALLITSLVFVGVLSVQAYHSYSNYGDWKKLSGQLPNYGDVKEQGLVGRSDSQQAVAKLSEQKGLDTYFHQSNAPYGFYTLVFSSDRGLFFFSPVLLLAFLGIYRLRKDMSLPVKILLYAVLVNVILYSSWGDPWGGWAFGPRYLIPAMAVLALFAGAGAAALGQKLWGKLAAFLLFAYSAAVALLGALVTNAVPPKIEAVNLPLKYHNYLYNLYLMRQGKNGSFLFNTYLNKYLSLQEYYLAIFGALLVIALVVLFAIPRIKPEEN